TADYQLLRANCADLGDRWLYVEGAPELLFTENESNAQRLWGAENASPYVKDASHEYLIGGNHLAVNPAQKGSKAAAVFAMNIAAGGSATISLRLVDRKLTAQSFGASFSQIFRERQQEA